MNKKVKLDWYKYTGYDLSAKCTCGYGEPPQHFKISCDPENPTACPKCGRRFYFTLDINIFEVPDPESIVGCGLAEDFYEPCDICSEVCLSPGCKEIRRNDGLTLTKLKDYEKVK